MQREAVRVSRALFNLHHDPHMMVRSGLGRVARVWGFE
jgi:hypothetical protein